MGNPLRFSVGTAPEMKFEYPQKSLAYASQSKRTEGHLGILSLHVQSSLPLCEALARLTLDSVLASKEPAAHTGQYRIITTWWGLTKRCNWGAREHREKAAWSNRSLTPEMGRSFEENECRETHWEHGNAGNKARTTESWTAPSTRGAGPCFSLGSESRVSKNCY